MKKALIYLHGFNSASLDRDGRLLVKKDKLRILSEFCVEKGILLYSPNVDYRDFEAIVEEMLMQRNRYLDQGYDVVFAGSSMGGFASEYLAMKTGAKAILINPVVTPTDLLSRFIGVSQNYETGDPYDWQMHHCEAYRRFERVLFDHRAFIHRTVLQDRGDELLDADKTIEHYQAIAHLVVFEGGSHGFDHMREALPVIERVIVGD